jgi:hypothetical protein
MNRSIAAARAAEPTIGKSSAHHHLLRRSFWTSFDRCESVQHRRTEMSRFSRLSAAALIGSAVAGLSAAQAGEITGNGKDIDINARTECAYSGYNDTPEGDPRDPGGRVQSYGYLVGYWDLVNPQDWDPNGDGFQRIPGYACNPNRFHDLHE